MSAAYNREKKFNAFVYVCVRSTLNCYFLSYNSNTKQQQNHIYVQCTCKCIYYYHFHIPVMNTLTASDL